MTASSSSRHLPIAAALLAIAAALALVACGGLESASQSELEQARAEAAEQARQSERIQQLQREVKKLGEGGGSGSSSGSSGGSVPSGGSAPPSSGSTSCGADVSAGPSTSCPFALNVADAYRSSGSSVVDVYSPVTGKTYTMSCSSGSPHVCTGGNDASVYFP